MNNYKIMLASLAAALTVASCSDEDYSAPVPAGNPVATASAPTSTLLMGDSVTLSVACTDNSGTALSTLKASLLLSGEAVDNVTVRTKTEGTYDVTLHMPYLQNIPDGTAQIALTLQNVTTKATTTTLDVPVARPHFSNFNFVAADGTKHAMTETGNHVYTTTYTSARNSFSGHFETADGTFLFGSDGNNGATLGTTSNLTFTTARAGQVTVSFNTATYAYAPLDELNITPVNFSTADGGNVWTGTLEQGALVSVSIDGADLPSGCFYDTDFFLDNGNGTFTFQAITGRYCLTANYSTLSLRIYKCADGTDDAETLASDGSGSLWIIGSEGINKPTWKAVNHGWWTGVDSDLCLAQISNKVHQITLTVGEQLDPNNVNFKFFGQPNWGTEFKGSGGSYCLTSTSDIFCVGNGTDGHDDGNIYIADGVTLTDGNTYVLTVDLTNGPANAVLSAVKK